jgi:hypothetical protein
MKKIVFALIILVVWVSPLLAETYNSPFGFSIDISPHWLIMSKQEIKDNPDLFNFEREEFKDFNKDLLSQIKNMVASGQIEVYFNKKTSNAFFSDNINVIKTIERLPQTASELNQLCTMIPKELSEYYGKPTKVYECEFKKVAGLDSLYLIFDGVLDGTTSMQYQIQKSPSVAITVTATSKNETFEIIKKEFDAIMASFTFNHMEITNNSKLHGTDEEQRVEPKSYELLEREEELKPPKLQEEKKLREINYDDGSKYIGDIVNGKRHGQGTYIWPDGKKYVGEFEHDRATGGWFYRTTGQKAWIYQDPEGKWIVREQ